jgi:hypothetical protein
VHCPSIGDAICRQHFTFSISPWHCPGLGHAIIWPFPSFIMQECRCMLSGADIGAFCGIATPTNTISNRALNIFMANLLKV